MQISEARPREDRAGLAVLMMCGAVSFFTMIDTSAKWLILAGLPPLQVVFARYCGHFVITMAVVLPREGLSAFVSRRPLLQFLRSMALLCSTILNFFALRYLPITVTTSIFFASPILVSLLSIPILGEKVGLRRLIAVLVGFVGVLVVVRPWGADFHPAMLLSLGALGCASFYFVLTRLIAGIESISTSQVWSSGLATLVLLPVVLSVWQLPGSVTAWAVMLTIGLWGAAGHVAATAAHRLADASILAPVVYLQLIGATLAGLLLFDTPPTIWTLVGALIIIGSGIYIWARERRLKLQPPLPPTR